MLALAITSAGFETVMDGIFSRQDVIDRLHSCAQFTARLRYVETDLKSDKVKCVECERLVTMPSFGEQSHEFGGVWVNGEPVDGEEREDEIESLRSKGMFAQRTLLPFLPETRDEYEYEVVRKETLRGMQVWRVEFTPHRETDRHITGSALVLGGTYDIVSMEFEPSDLPFVVTGASMELDYEFLNGRWVPVSFEMDMDLRLAFIIELMRRHVRIEETYRDYSFTSAEPARPESGH
jgi:hypothetical protein